MYIANKEGNAFQFQFPINWHASKLQNPSNESSINVEKFLFSHY